MDMFTTEDIKEREMPRVFEWHVDKYKLLTDNDFRFLCRYKQVMLKNNGYRVDFIKCSEKEPVNRYKCEKVGARK